LISGLGADEQLGGYSRHSVSFKEKGWSGLLKELQHDVDRICTRNLGRDDRVISDHGKEVRFPFLDEKVVEYLSGLCIDLKMEHGLGKGIEDCLRRNRGQAFVEETWVKDGIGAW
jgi:asparagine synthetase B (glutamine-hydrolysing)